ncbi:MAG: hypothetical protein MJ168_12400, partial [Clostridia bacterium]|nr:hypothetical protein [Clostridia bacterium]
MRLPYVRGARNQAATGQTFPFIIGETLYTPLRLCPPHYTIAGAKGEKQYYNAVFECGYNDVLIKEVRLGDTVIKRFSNTAPQNVSTGWDRGIYYDADNIIEIRQRDAFTNDDFNKKIVLTDINKEIPHRHASDDPAENQRIQEEWQAGVVQQLATNPMAVEVIALFDGLQAYKDNGWASTSITLQPQWCNNPDDVNPTWHNFSTGFVQNGTSSNTFTYNTKEQMRFNAVQTFTAAQAYGKKISIRVIRTTQKEESNARDTVYLMAVQTYCYDAKKSNAGTLVPAKIIEDNERSKCCRMAVRVAANQNTSGQLDAFSIIAAGVAQTWNGTEWSAEKTTTRNLAAWAREIMISDKHLPSQYQPEELDDASWGLWFDYCLQQGFYADGVITKGTKKQTIIEKLCQNSNAALVYSPLTGKIEVEIDNGREYSVALLNKDTIQSISTTKEFKRRPTGKKVTYINRSADYEIDSVTFMQDGGEYDPQTDTLTTTALEFITDYNHAFKYAWRQMAEETAQPRVVTVKVGHEAAYYPLFSRVELQHPSLKIGISHAQIESLTWFGGLLQSIKLTAPVKFSDTAACGVLISCVSDTARGLLQVKVSGTGKTDTLEVITQVRQSDAVKPYAGNFLSFGELDIDGNFTTVTKTMKIVNAEDTDDGYTLTLVDYNPALYQYGALPEYHSNITTVPSVPAVPIEDQREYIQPADLQDAAEQAAGAVVGGAAQAAVDAVTHGYTFTNVYNIRPVEETLEEIIAKLDADARNASASISISEEEILLQVNDMERELVGLIDIQAGS